MRKGAITLWRAAVGLGVVGLWEAAVAMGVVDPFFVSRPSAIAGRMWVWASTGFVWTHLAITLQESILGLLIGSILGTVSGFALARATTTAKVLEPYIMMLNAVPRVLLAPLFLLWFGLGIWSKVALSVTLVFFIMFFNAYQGVRQADPVLIENARMLGATERQLVRHVLVPSALTWIFSSLQTSLGFAMIGAVVGEYLGATRGLGYVISQAEGTFDTTGVFSGMAILSLVVVVMSRGVARAEDWLLRWKRPLVGLLVAVVAAAGSSACRQAGRDAGAPVRVAIGGQTQMVYLPTTLTQELGFYKEEGVEVELQDFEGGAKALQALIGGSADVVSGFYDHTIQMAAEGRPLTAFVVMLRYPGLVLLTSPQAAGRITSVAALEGWHRRRHDPGIIIAVVPERAPGSTQGSDSVGQRDGNRKRCRGGRRARTWPGRCGMGGRSRTDDSQAAQPRHAGACRPARRAWHSRGLRDRQLSERSPLYGNVVAGSTSGYGRAIGQGDRQDAALDAGPFGAGDRRESPGSAAWGGLRAVR
jgi:NitT/TauT family transport system permease protein